MKLAYRLDPDYASDGRHYAPPLIAWPSIIAGAAVAIAVGLALNLIGVAVGAAAFNPFRFEAQEDTVSAGAALYLMFSQFVAFQLGAYVAARSAPYPDHFGGSLTGLVVWASAIVFAVATASLTANGGQVVVTRILEAAQDVRAGGDAGDLSSVEAAADAAATFAWIAAASLLLGAAGAIAGGWLGAHHPVWEGRPRVAYSPRQS